MSEADDHVISTFYWGPMASGSSQVLVTATVKNVNTGTKISGLTDSVEFNVLKPTGTMSRISIGIPGVTPPQESGPQRLSMAKDTPRNPDTGHATGTPLGIRYSSSVTAPGGFGGVFMHNQTMTTTERRMYRNATTGDHSEALGKYNGQPYDLSSNFVLDTYVGYEGRVDDPRVGPGTSPKVSFAPVGHTFYSNDSPASPLVLLGNDIGIVWSRSDDFSVKLMYNPLVTDPKIPPAGPPDSIWVPVRELSWYWRAYAAFSNGIWVDNPSPNYAPASGPPSENSQPSTLYPFWSVNIDDANGNNGGNPWVPLQ